MFSYSVLLVTLCISSAFGEEITGCEQEDITLTCPEDLVILASNVTYCPVNESVCSTGRESNDTEAEYCMCADNTKSVNFLCSNQTNCTLHVTRQYFENPCPSRVKQLVVEYDCVTQSEFEAAQPTERPCPTVTPNQCRFCPRACEPTCRYTWPRQRCPFPYSSLFTRNLCIANGCYCRRGYVRDRSNGECTRPGDCTNPFRFPRFG